MKKILILHTSVGLGHKSIAENIGYYLSQAGYEVRLEDIAKVQEGKFSKATIAVHQYINKRVPSVWAFIYKWGHYPILPFRVFIASFNHRQTKELLEKFRPDLVITVQTAASAVIAYLKQKGYYQNPWGIAFSDYHLHPYWLYEGADFYLANIEEQKQEMVRRGISGEKIFVCGMTIRQRVAVDSSVVKSKLGLLASDKVVLIGAGSLGIGFPEGVFDRLKGNVAAAVVVVCGKNKEVYNEMQKYAGPRFKVLGFYQPMEELYAIADVFVTKPGGLTVAEALQQRLPMLVTHWLPGQEELNCRYLSERRLIKLIKPERVAESVRQELESGEMRASLEQNPNIPKIVSHGEEVVKAVRWIIGT